MRVGIVGAGRIGALHALTCAKDPAVGHVDVVDPAGLPSALEHLGTDWYESLAGAPANTWDAAIVAAPTSEHVALVGPLIDAGVAVLCEKPSSFDAESAEAVAARAAVRGVPLRSGLQRRLDPALCVLREIVASGRLGHPLSGYSTTLDPAPPSREYLVGSGGIFLDMHIHDFDALAWLLDDAIVAVQASGAEGVPGYAEGLDDHGVTQVSALTAGGVLCAITGSRWSGAGYRVLAGVRGVDGQAWVEADGRVTLHDREGVRSVRGGTGRAPAGFVDRFADAYRIEVEAFLAEVRGAERRCATWLDDIRAVRVAGAARRAARSGTRVDCVPDAGWRVEAGADLPTGRPLR